MNYLDIFLRDPLYTSYDLNEIEFDIIVSLLFSTKYADIYKTLDSYCTVCEKDTTFISEIDQYSANQLEKVLVGSGYNSRGDGNLADFLKALEEIGLFQRIFTCPRPNSDNEHNQIFLFRVVNGKLIKIGQSPALADLTHKEIKKYQKLDKNVYQELNRAIGLASHGIGVGAFVYLRRIVEKHILQPKLDVLVLKDQTSKEEIANSNFKSKISMVKADLPKFLVENTKLYSVLSKGIHSLEEDECKMYFPILRASIEIILDQEIEEIERQKKNKFLIDQLNSIRT